MCSLDCPVTFCLSHTFIEFRHGKKKRRGEERKLAANAQRRLCSECSVRWVEQRSNNHESSIAIVGARLTFGIPSFLKRKKKSTVKSFFLQFRGSTGPFFEQKVMIFIKKKTWTDEKEKSRMIFTSQHPVPLELPYLEKKEGVSGA